jgi:hypothetical protein
MRRYLVVANQTLQAAELRDELRKRISAGPCSFFVIVPGTTAAQYDHVAAGGVLPQPGMWWWATYYARPATDEEATAQARQRLSVMLDGLAALGAPVEGDLGSSDPLEAIEKVRADRQFDEIIVTTLPQCQRPLGNPVGWPGFLRVGGHQFSRLVAACSPGGRGLGCQRDHPLAGEGLGEAVRVAFGQDQVGVVEQPVDGGGGQGLGHDGVEA